MRMLFVHGAGAREEDRPLADALGLAVQAQVDYLQLPAEDMSFESWAAPVRDRLARLGDRDLAVGHSFGASVLLRVLSERRYELARAALLAMPYWGPAGWDVAEYAFDGAEPALPLSLHHCRDDAVVPFEHLTLNATSLPSATVREHQTGGHQLDGLAEPIAAELRR